MEIQKTERLGSLDILRGFDLFCLVFFRPVFRQFAHAMDLPFTNWLTTKFQHVQWEGFVFFDIDIPLYMLRHDVPEREIFKSVKKESKI